MGGLSRTSLLGCLFNLVTFTLSQDVPLTTSQPIVVSAATSASEPTVASLVPGTSLPVATTPSPEPIIPTCIEPRSPTDPSGADISGALASVGAVNQACGGDGQQTADIGLLKIVYYSTGSIFLNVSHSTLVSAPIEVSASFCPDHFNAILDSCIVNGNFWGGWWSTVNANYTVTNQIYPANGLPGAEPISSEFPATTILPSATPLPIETSVPGEPGTIFAGTTVVPLPATTTDLAGTTAVAQTTVAPGTTALPGTILQSGASEIPGTILQSRASEIPGTTDSPESTVLPETTPTPGTTEVPGTELSGTIIPPGTTAIPGTTGLAGSTGSPGTSTPPATNVLPATTVVPGTELKGTTISPGPTVLPGTELPGTTVPLGTTAIPGTTELPGTGLSGTTAPAGTTVIPGTTALPGSTDDLPSTISSLSTSEVLPSGYVVVTATVNSQIVSETFAPSTDSAFLTLATTISTFSVNPQGSTISYEIGPGGVQWQPVTASTGVPGPDLPRPTTLPANPNAPTETLSNIPISTPASSLSLTSNLDTTTSVPTTTRPGGTTANPAPTTTNGQPPITPGPSTTNPPEGTVALSTITQYNSDVSSIGTIIGVTANTHISTGDASHPSAIVPVLWGCWFCPHGGGLLLWGMTFPGIYPPPVPPPFPSFPPITIGNDGIPTPSPSPTDPKPSDQQPSQTASKPTTESASASQTATTGTASSGTQSVSASTASASTSASASAEAQPCKRDLTFPHLITKRDVFIPRLGKREEKTVPGTSPLKSALSNLGTSDALDSATGLITNRIGDKLMDANGNAIKDAKGRFIDLGTANTFVSGLVGKLPIPQGSSINIGGVKFTGEVPWTIRWDFDATKLSHVNAKFGKSGEATFAYTFSTGNDDPDSPTKNNYAENYMRNAVRSLTQAARLDIGASHQAGQPRFIQGTTFEEATQTIIGLWKNIMDAPCPALGAPRDPALDPNT